MTTSDQGRPTPKAAPRLARTRPASTGKPGLRRFGAVAGYSARLPTRSMHTLRRLTRPCTLSCTGPQCSRRATAPPLLCLLRFPKNGTLLEGEQKKTRAPSQKKHDSSEQSKKARQVAGAIDGRTMRLQVSSLEYSGTGHSETWPFPFAYFVH